MVRLNICGHLSSLFTESSSLEAVDGGLPILALKTSHATLAPLFVITLTDEPQRRLTVDCHSRRLLFVYPLHLQRRLVRGSVLPLALLCLLPAHLSQRTLCVLLHRLQAVLRF